MGLGVLGYRVGTDAPPLRVFGLASLSDAPDPLLNFYRKEYNQTNYKGDS
jgi:hypothetical protein